MSEHPPRTCMETRTWLEGPARSTPGAEIVRHLAECSACRLVQAERDWTAEALAGYELPAVAVDLWPRVERRMRRRSLVIALPVAVVVFACRFLESAPPYDFSLWVKLMPLLAIFVLFRSLRLNPFRIETRVGDLVAVPVKDSMV